MKIAFIDHSFHKKTQSSEFFINIINKNNNVDCIWYDSCVGDNFININEINNGNYDLLIFWQIIAMPYQVQKIKCKNIIWIPMYDTEIIRPLYSLQTIGYLNFNIRIISFSKALANKMKKVGFKVLNLQYYPDPTNISNKSFDHLNIIFWQRIKKINFKLVKNLLIGNKINQIFYKNNPDPNQNIAIPNKNEVELINGWLNEKDYKDLLDRCNIYIAPRKYEGIGMTFLKAMAAGLIIISPDEPTANEYIKDGYNGYLYDMKKPKPIDLSNIKEVSKNLEKSFMDGYESWQNQKIDILEFIKPDNYKLNIKYKILYLIYCLYSPILEILRGLKRLLKIKFY